MKRGEAQRSIVILNLSEAWYNLTCDGQGAPEDVTRMLLHRLRSILRDGPCPDCPTCSLHEALEAVDGTPQD